MLEHWVVIHAFLVGGDVTVPVTGVALVGFAAAFFVRANARSRLARAPYFALSMLLYLCASVMSCLWLFSYRAALTGTLWTIYAAAFVFALGAGYVLGVLAIARSRDAFGSQGYGILSFIPVLNLILFFKGPNTQAAPAAVEIPVLRVFRGGIGIALGVLLLCASSVLSGLQKIVLQSIMATVPLEDVLRPAVRAIGIEDTLQRMAAAVHGDLPVAVDGTTLLTAVSADGKRLRRTYTAINDSIVDDGADNDGVLINATMRRNINAKVCGGPRNAMLIGEGAEIEEHYESLAGKSLGRHVVDEAACLPHWYAADRAAYVRTHGVEKAIRAQAAMTRLWLPYKVDHRTSAISVETQGRRLQRTFMVTDDSVTFGPDARAARTRKVCDFISFAPLLHAGAEIIDIFVKQDGTFIARIAVNKKQCGF